MSGKRMTFGLTDEQDWDLRRAAESEGMGPSAYSRHVVLLDVVRVLSEDPDAVPGAPGTRGRPRPGETRAQARERRASSALRAALGPALYGLCDRAGATEGATAVEFARALLDRYATLVLDS